VLARECGRFCGVVMKAFLNLFREFGEVNLRDPDFVINTMPSGSTRLTFALLYSFPSIVLKSSARATDAKQRIETASVFI